MSARRGSWNALIALAAMAALVAHHGAAAPPSTPPVIGLAQNTPAVYALTNVRIISEPGKLIEKGTIVVRDGVIETVGADAKPPADARVLHRASSGFGRSSGTLCHHPKLALNRGNGPLERHFRK